jgi:predicted ester cyclase
MSAEQVVRDFLSAFETDGVDAAVPYLADDMTLQVTYPPLEGGRDEFIGHGALIKAAMPDYRWGVQNMTAVGNQVTVTMRWSGTHTGMLHLSAFAPGAPDIPPTGKKLIVADKFVFTVMGDQITGVYVDSPPNGGLTGMLQQLGIQLPTQ